MTRPLDITSLDTLTLIRSIDMRYIGYAIVPLVVGLLTPLVFFWIRKQNLKKESKMNYNDFIISSSIALCSILIITEIVFATLIILLNIFEMLNVLQNAICISFLLFLVLGTYALIREKIVIKQNKIEHTPVFGKKRIYLFSDIKSVIEVSTSRGLVSYQIYSDKKMFIISNLSIGTKLFINRIKAIRIPIETKIR